MGHVGVLAFPVGRFYQFIHLSQAAFGIHSTCKTLMVCLRVFAIFSIQFITLFIVWLLAVVDEEIDTGGQEVGSGCLEELVATSSRTFLTFLKRFYQGFSSLVARVGNL